MGYDEPRLSPGTPQGRDVYQHFGAPMPDGADVSALGAAPGAALALPGQAMPPAGFMAPGAFYQQPVIPSAAPGDDAYGAYEGWPDWWGDAMPDWRGGDPYFRPGGR